MGNSIYLNLIQKLSITLKTRLITLLILTLSISSYGNAQVSEIESIRISQTYEHKSINILIYDLRDSIFTYQKTQNRKAKPINSTPSSFFLDSNTYESIDSMFSVENYQSPCLAKLNRYRIILVYKSKVKNKYKLSRKIKMFDFAASAYPEICKDYTPSILDQVILEYNKIVNTKK